MSLGTTVRIDDREWREWKERAGRQFPFGLAIGLNRTAEEALAAARAQIRRRFVVRTDWILPPLQLPREWRATTRHLESVIAIGAGGAKETGERRRAILEPFQEGKPKTMRTADRPVAIPTSVLRPSFRDLVKRSMYPMQLVGRFSSLGEAQGLGRTARVKTTFRTGPGGTRVTRKAVGRYFVLGWPGDPHWGIYARTGPGRPRKLWMFRMQVPRPARLDWYGVGQRVIRERLGPNVVGGIAYAMQTARAAAGGSDV